MEKMPEDYTNYNEAGPIVGRNELVDQTSDMSSREKETNFNFVPHHFEPSPPPYTHLFL